MTEVDPEVVRLQLLSKLVKYQKSMIQEGIVEGLHPITVTIELVTVTPPFRTKPWFSVKIINDGDDSVLANVNSGKSQEVEIKGGEMGGFDFSTAIITNITLRTEIGSSSVRIRGLR